MTHVKRSEVIDIANETILTIGEAAERLKVSKGTITNWIKVGTKGLRLESIKFGSHWRTSEEALQRFGDQQTPQYEQPFNLTGSRTTSKQAQRAHQQAMDELDEALGVKKCKTCKVVIETGKLRAFRWAKQLPLKSLASKTGITVEYLRSYELGDNDPKPDHLQKLAEFFGERLVNNLQQPNTSQEAS